MGKARKVVEKALGSQGQEVRGINQEVYEDLLKASEGILSREQVDNMLESRAKAFGDKKIKSYTSADKYLKELNKKLVAGDKTFHEIQFLDGGKDKLAIASGFAGKNGSISKVLTQIRDNPGDFNDIKGAIDALRADATNYKEISQYQDNFFVGTYKGKGKIKAAADNISSLRRYDEQLEAAKRERLDQQRFDRDVSRVNTENDNLNHVIVEREKAELEAAKRELDELNKGPTEEELEKMYAEASKAQKEGILPYDEQLAQANAAADVRAERRKSVSNTNREAADSLSPDILNDMNNLMVPISPAPSTTPIANIFKKAQKQAAEDRLLDSMTVEERIKYLQKQREAETATRAGQRKAARTLEEEPNGFSYIGAYDPVGENGALGYSGVYFDKDDLVSMLMGKHSEKMGSKGAIEYMTNNIQRDLDKGYQRIMSSNSKNKKEEIDNLIGELASRIDIDDGPGLRDYIMGNKLHTGAIGFAAMASTMGIAFGGHKSNAELYSSPF